MEIENKNQQENKEALANEIFFIVFFGIIASVVLFTFCKYFILRNYYVITEADCNPETEKCFVWRCDPEALEDSEKCTGDPDQDVQYYGLIRKNASLVPSCERDSEGCPAVECFSGEDCEKIFCDETTALKGEECNDPEEYKELESEAEEEECDNETMDCPVDTDAGENVIEGEDGAENEVSIPENENIQEQENIQINENPSADDGTVYL